MSETVPRAQDITQGFLRYSVSDSVSDDLLTPCAVVDLTYLTECRFRWHPHARLSCRVYIVLYHSFRTSRRCWSDMADTLPPLLTSTQKASFFSMASAFDDSLSADTKHAHRQMAAAQVKQFIPCQNVCRHGP